MMACLTHLTMHDIATIMIVVLVVGAIWHNW